MDEDDEGRADRRRWASCPVNVPPESVKYGLGDRPS
jgi:hypothetical protein